MDEENKTFPSKSDIFMVKISTFLHTTCKGVSACWKKEKRNFIFSICGVRSNYGMGENEHKEM